MEDIPATPATEYPIDVGANFKATHWSDAQIFYNNYTMTNLSEVIEKKWNAATATAQKALAMVLRNKDGTAPVSMTISKQVLEAMSSAATLDVAPEDLKASEKQSEHNPGEEGEAEQVEEAVAQDPAIPEGHYMLCYGPKTVELIQKALTGSFKLFWDGSVSLYMETALSAKNNKDVLNTLLEMRQATNEAEEPPVTLLHGNETEKLLRATLLRIKIEQQEAVEAAARAKEQRAAMEDEESEAMQQSEMEMESESEEKMTTFDEDLEIVTDFGVFGSCEFTTKVMQGVDVKCLLSFAEHTKPSKEQVEEDLKILDDI